MLNALLGAGLAWTVVACASSPPPPTPPADAAVVASWTADDGSIVVLNVVVGPGTDRRSLPDLARRQRESHPDARVIVTIFADTAGPERHVIGHAPAGDEPLAAGDRPSSALATFDFPRPTPGLTDAPTAGGP